MTNTEEIKVISKSEWLEFSSPLAEPTITWNNKNKYQIERIEKEDGTIIWFGQGTNWVKPLNESWTYLGVDESVNPTIFIKGENGMGDYAEYPEGRNIFIECEPPIYEKLYQKLKELTKNQ